MKKKHLYVLTGIKQEQVTVWRDYIREDMTFIEKGGITIPVIELSWLEAVKMKFQIIRNNIISHYGFGLVRI